MDGRVIMPEDKIHNYNAKGLIKQGTNISMCYKYLFRRSFDMYVHTTPT